MDRSVTRVNSNHDELCGSPEWAAYLQEEVLPAVTAGVDLGQVMLEIGPGPGAATGWLCQRVRQLAALERDEPAAAALAAKFPRVQVTVGDAARMSYPDCSFDSVGSFTMLHHVPTTTLQNQILAEALRVLRPGGVLVGSDSLPSNELHQFHEGDTCHPVEPAALLVRLQTLGFAAVMVAVDDGLTFTARKAELPGGSCGVAAPGHAAWADAPGARRTLSGKRAERQRRGAEREVRVSDETPGQFAPEPGGTKLLVVHADSGQAPAYQIARLP